jgi:hypothetical protein
VVLGWDVVGVVGGKVVVTELVVVAIVVVVSIVSATVTVGAVEDEAVVSVTTSALQAAITKTSARPREACLIVRLLRPYPQRIGSHASLISNICSI